jgi:hypothetical protein
VSGGQTGVRPRSDPGLTPGRPPGRNKHGRQPEDGEEAAGSYGLITLIVR